MHERVLQGLAQAASQLAARFREAAAGDGHHHVAGAQQFCWALHVAVRRQVDLDAGQQAKIVGGGAVDQLDGSNLLLQVAATEPAAGGVRVGSIAHGDVLVAHLAGGLGD